MTATNDDRARVAQALREMETPTWPTLTEAVMGHVATREKVLERLAELIEPDTTSDTTKTVEDTTKLKFEMLGVVNSITGVIFDLRQKVEASEVDVNGEGASITFTVPVDQAKNLFGKVAKITVEVEE
jgi:hypothetical protein